MPERSIVRQGEALSLPPLQSARLLDRLRERVRLLHYSRRTEEAYVHWVRAYIRFHHLRLPAEMGQAEVESFLTWLAGERQVSASTHRQALSALLFLYVKVLGTDLPWMRDIGRPRSQRRVPVVLSKEELVTIFAHMEGEHRLWAQLLYGTGLRITEGLPLRIKDVDFEHRAVVVREGKGGKDRVVMLPDSLVPALREQMAEARILWAADQADGRGGVFLPDALERKYPRAGCSWTWFWLFPQASYSSLRRGSASSLVRPDVPARVQAGGRVRGHPQAGNAAHIETFVRHTSAAVRLRHPHGAGPAGPCGRGYDDDLYPRPEGRWRCRAQSSGCAGGALSKVGAARWGERTQSRRSWISACGRPPAATNDRFVNAKREEFRPAGGQLWSGPSGRYGSIVPVRGDEKRSLARPSGVGFSASAALLRAAIRAGTGSTDERPKTGAASVPSTGHRHRSAETRTSQSLRGAAAAIRTAWAPLPYSRYPDPEP